MDSSGWPISFDDVLAARERLRPHLAPSPLRSYPALDEATGGDVRVLVKHENLQPTGAFKVRNAVSALTLRGDDERRRGIVAATEPGVPGLTGGNEYNSMEGLLS